MNVSQKLTATLKRLDQHDIIAKTPSCPDLLTTYLALVFKGHQCRLNFPCGRLSCWAASSPSPATSLHCRPRRGKPHNTRQRQKLWHFRGNYSRLKEVQEIHVAKRGDWLNIIILFHWKFTSLYFSCDNMHINADNLHSDRSTQVWLTIQI